MNQVKFVFNSKSVLFTQPVVQNIEESQARNKKTHHGQNSPRCCECRPQANEKLLYEPKIYFLFFYCFNVHSYCSPEAPSDGESKNKGRTEFQAQDRDRVFLKVSLQSRGCGGVCIRHKKEDYLQCYLVEDFHSELDFEEVHHL